MLHLIFGRAGSGKTEYARQLVCEQISTGGSVFIMVPEQNSFECERDMLHRLGAKNARRAEVLSFTRLNDRVGREYGGFAGRRLTDTGRTLFMSLALAQTADRLELYRRAAENSEFIDLLLGLSAACKMGAVSPEQMTTVLGSESGTLSVKMQELGLILGVYDSLVAQRFSDPQDDLTRLAEQLRTQGFFQGKTVVLDAFKGFTAQQFEVLESVIAQSADCWITLCTDQLNDPEQGMGLFSNVRRTARRLIDCARRHGVSVAAPVTLSPGGRFRGNALAAMEAHLFRCDGKTEVAADTSLVVAHAANKYEEAGWIAAEIHRMVRKEGRRYRDFTVIVRREEDYDGILDRALKRAGIPFFMDVPADVTGTVLMAYVLSALEAANSRMDSDAVFRCLKTGLFGLDTEQLAELENYVFLWGIDKEAWLSPWKGNPQGFSDTYTEEDARLLERLNAMRAQIVPPLEALMKSTRFGTGEEMAAAVYRFLCDTHAADHLTGAADALRDDGEAGSAEEQLRLWKLLMDILDQTALVLREALDGKRYARLLEMAIRSAKLGELPQSLDEVTVGGADRTRPAAPKIVFLAGAVQGVFPGAVSSGGLFTETERRILSDRGVEIVRGAEEQAVEERFLAYTAACSPSERLIISSYGTTGTGEGALPSELVSEVKRICPKVRVVSCNRKNKLPETVAEAFDRMAAGYGTPKILQSTLQSVFQTQEQWTPAMRAVERAANPKDFRFESEEIAKRLFGERMRISPSRVENYYQCPFQYFCRYGMNAKERRPARIDALEYGTMIHYLLENMLMTKRNNPDEEWTTQGLKKWIHQLMIQYLQERLGGSEGKSQRFLALYERFEEVALRLMEYIRMEMEQSAFQPAAFELEIGTDGPVQPVHIPLPDGGRIEIVGKIDRVDLMEEDGKAYIRVLDYKTGKKKFALNDLLYGINMQMLIYLMILNENGFGDHEEPVPAGVLYLPARSPKINAAHTDTAESLTAEALTEMRMSGIVLHDQRVLEGMEAEGQGFFIPVRRKRDGTPDTRAMLYTMEQFGVIAQHMKRLIGEMGAHLHAGEVPAMPTGKICTYCSFASVCGREKKDPAREVPSLGLNETLERMTRELEGKEERQ